MSRSQAVHTAVERDISDATLLRMFKIVGGVLAAALLLIGGVGAVRWAQSAGDRETPLSNVDVGFLQDMIVHHEQALVIARAYMDNNPGGDAYPYASEVVLFQGSQLTRMEKWLADAGFDRGAPDRQGMTWMGMGTDLAAMPGMQPPERIAELSSSTGPTADRLFFDIMSDHHLGGAGMADYAAEFGARTEIKEFAEGVAYNQRIEVVEYEQTMERLGLTT